MAFNGSGLFQRLYNFGNDALNAIFIRADRMDAEMDGFAAGLSNAITRDGQGKPIATMDWNGQNLTNAGTITAISFVGTTPTMPLGTNDTRLVNAASLAAAITANTAGVSTFNARTGAITLTQADIASAGGVSMFNSRSGAITLTSADITSAGGAASSLLAGTGGAALVGFQGLGASTIRTGQDKLRELVSVKDFGAVGDGATNGSTAIQAAIASLPVTGGCIHFPVGNYVFSGITVNKPLRIVCEGGFDGGVTFTNPTAAAAFFTGVSVNGFIADGFRATASVVRTGGKYFDFTTSNRLSFSNFFMDKYYIGIGVDGGSEITIDRFQMFDGVADSAVSGSGGILLGDTNYTGAISIDNGYIKCQNATLQSSFGIRLKYVDVVALGAGLTIISHGSNLDIIPGTGQTASLIRSLGAVYDTAKLGVHVAPSGTGRVIRSSFRDGWYGFQTTSGIMIDGTTGTIDGLTFAGGDAIGNVSCGVNIIGPNASNIYVRDMNIASNAIGVRAVSSANAYVDSNQIGAIGAASANASGISIDTSVTGYATRNRLFGNTTNISGTAAGFPTTGNV